MLVARWVCCLGITGCVGAVDFGTKGSSLEEYRSRWARNSSWCSACGRPGFRLTMCSSYISGRKGAQVFFFGHTHSYVLLYVSGSRGARGKSQAKILESTLYGVKCIVNVLEH
jgi:hypothetical protein